MRAPRTAGASLNVLLKHHTHTHTHTHIYVYRSCWGPLLVVLLLLIILLPMSFHNVEYYEVAFAKRRSTGTISRDKVYYPGRHCIGPDTEFVKFPASEQTVDFKGMSVWTKTERVSSGVNSLADWKNIRSIADETSAL